MAAETASRPDPNSASSRGRWLTRTVLGISLTSLAGDWSHEMATALLPALLLSIGAGPGWLGAIEGVADGLSSFTKLAAGHWTDRLRRRKPLIVAAYGFTAAATGSLALAMNAIEVMLARSAAWLGRGVRNPAKKALLAAAVPPAAYGRAFGLERMMDTLGAIAGPVTALWLLANNGHDYRRVFLWTLLPGGIAGLLFAVFVREGAAHAVQRKSFLASIFKLPPKFLRFLLAVGVFGLGDFSHTLLILYATRQLTPSLGLAAASSLAIGLYLVHNAFYAGSAYLAGWLSDRAPQRKLVLAAGYGLAIAMSAVLLSGPSRHALLVVVFALAGSFVGVIEPLEDSLAAELVPPEQHGMAFGTLAAVNAIGDFGSSIFIGAVWSFYSSSAGFGVAGGLFLAALLLLLRWI